MPAIRFTRDDFENLEMVRQIVLQRLRDDPRFQLFNSVWGPETERFVTFDEPQGLVRQHFQMLENEVLWQLLIQGVITPGKDASNSDFPWFRITKYGREVLKAERFLPHDPTGYIGEVGQATRTVVGLSGLVYLEEALRCFMSGCHLASVLLLGIAAEAVLLQLCEVARNALQNPNEKAQFDNLKWVKPKHRWLVDRYNALPSQVRSAQLPESLDMTLASLYELIRKQRNELGHPQQQPPTITREAAFVYFRLFPIFISDAEAFAEHCKTNGL